MRFTLLFLLTLVLSIAKGQTVEYSYEVEKQQPLQLIFNQADFGDKFSVLFTSDDQFDYYVIDLSKLEGRFEKVYFMNLAFNEPKIVNLDGDVSKDQTWFKSYYTYKSDEISCLFKELKEKSAEVTRTMTVEEKSEWMLQNDKFKK